MEEDWAAQPIKKKVVKRGESSTVKLQGEYTE